MLLCLWVLLVSLGSRRNNPPRKSVNTTWRFLHDFATIMTTVFLGYIHHFICNVTEAWQPNDATCGGSHGSANVSTFFVCAYMIEFVEVVYHFYETTALFNSLKDLLLFWARTDKLLENIFMDILQHRTLIIPLIRWHISTQQYHCKAIKINFRSVYAK